MKKNPFLKADHKVIAMYGNTAVLCFVQKTRTYDSSTGGMTDSSTITQCTVQISKPSVISEAVADGKKYLIGDITFEVSRVSLESVVPAGRTLNMQCGLDIDNDYFTLDNIKYRIVKIQPENMWKNTPSKYKVQLRLN